MSSPSSTRRPDRLLILSVFIVASCGLAYELVAGALASYLLGDSVLQFSSIIGCYLFAMGVGSHLSKYVKDEDLLARFIDIELLVGLIGGASATVLFVIFAWMAGPFRSVLYALVFALGVLVGMEIPLVMRLLNERKTGFSEIVSRVLTFDYLGALFVSLLFPIVLAPHLGLARTAFLFGIANAGVALLAIRVFRSEIRQRRALTLRASIVLVLLVGGFAASERITQWSERGVFGDEIVHAETTPYQRLVVTKWKDDLRLYINGNLQFSSRDEHRYHEALVHPVLAALPGVKRVLVLGGGDGLAIREILKYPSVEEVTLVDLDPAMTRLFSSAAPLTALNRNAFKDHRVHIINADAGQWLETAGTAFDAIIIDLPDPNSYGLGKLYSEPFYRLVREHLAENGLMVVQSTSPYFAPHAYWCVVTTLEAAGFKTYPYHAYVPSFGEWGFVIADRTGRYQPPTHYALPMRWLDGTATRDMFRFPADMQRIEVEPNRLNSQALVRYFEEDWHRVIR
ncbi:polyamine aminopropyltransferase [Uliginosibacterium sp. 31-16]|uniref:polyamine aminopropyltransferase n=1 Tax=Uliginosibacterium sp. 31-16 TaxID=3068315 RepID=UPI00273F7AB1|nr:polyamine aminopropyltransferase [Uliginosibacterium sp. 31-16]MDP5238959.1 polyamine aminopropyltransferase [Uliginosibacterium sp. 31-16]